MSKHPRVQHQGHHLSVRSTLWKTYIVCDECGQEYETAWYMLYKRFQHRIHWLLCLLFIFVLFLLGWQPDSTKWFTAPLYGAAYAVFLTLLRICLNALQAFLLRQSDDLAAHIF